LQLTLPAIHSIRFQQAHNHASIVHKCKLDRNKQELDHSFKRHQKTPVHLLPCAQFREIKTVRTRRQCQARIELQTKLANLRQLQIPQVTVQPKLLQHQEQLLKMNVNRIRMPTFAKLTLLMQVRRVV
jgi:hypothetical protein